MTIAEWKTEHGDRTAPQNEILRTTVGSGVHGIAIDGQDDHDELGVYIEPPTTVLGIGRVDGHYTARTVPEGHRSRPGDTDLTLYSLRKYLGLVATGNPTALLPLFAPESDILHITHHGRKLREFGPKLLSQQAGHRFLGYLHSQRQRIVTGKQTPNRPELVEKYGYDVKYAAHALRLAYQGWEVVTKGSLTLPLPESKRKIVLSIKTGEWTLHDVLHAIDQRAEMLTEALESGHSPLPERPDLDLANGFLVAMHFDYWEVD